VKLCFSRPIIFIDTDYQKERIMRLNKRKVVPLIIVLCSIFTFVLLFYPNNKVLLFSEQRSENPINSYISLKKDQNFQIRYVHSIHLTDVIEAYEITNNEKIRFLSMTYENIGIGLPGTAGEGETFSFIDGLYSLTYDDHIIDSFVMFIANIDAELAFQYMGNELDLKKKLKKGKSYKISVEKKSLFQLMKGVNLL